MKNGILETNFPHMKTIILTTALLFGLMSFNRCTTSDSTDSKEASPTTKSDELVDENKQPETAKEESKTQSVKDRIAEIKQWYAQIQTTNNVDKNCTTKAKKIIVKDLLDEDFPMTNHAKSCKLQDGLKYEQVELNGYEWGEKTTFYHKDEKRFFVFTTGGAEACAYEYRVYYDNAGEVIRLLLSENDCTGNEVSAPFEVKNETRKTEILKSIADAEKELREILGK